MYFWMCTISIAVNIYLIGVWYKQEVSHIAYGQYIRAIMLSAKVCHVQCTECFSTGINTWLTHIVEEVNTDVACYFRLIKCPV